jgi:magnesium transporter
MNMHYASTERIFLLSDLIGLKARAGDKRVGKLSDIVVTEAGRIPETTHLLISRPFGYRPLMIPWDRVGKIDGRSIALDIEALEPFEGDPAPGQVCLKDHLLDKKVLDCDDDEVEVVYDIKLVLRGGKLYVSDVDCSRAAFLHRIGLGGLASFVRSMAKDETIPWTYVQRLPENMGSFSGAVKLNVLKAKLPEIHPVDLADILEELDHHKRLAIFNELETGHASDTLK